MFVITVIKPMKRNLTLSDLNVYASEVRKLEQGMQDDTPELQSPAESVLRNLLSYSKALEVCPTRMAGDAFLLMN